MTQAFCPFTPLPPRRGERKRSSITPSAPAARCCLMQMLERNGVPETIMQLNSNQAGRGRARTSSRVIYEMCNLYPAARARVRSYERGELMNTWTKSGRGARAAARCEAVVTGRVNRLYHTSLSVSNRCRNELGYVLI
ncbi:hypothetical protein EVAR_31798_1 [Eumeta japonica]|uniref:Uncharacterized protein n=1 Tax=Eumeta variegata TaxID=151549 RepID=A0A4C1W4B3_EUMVA|nr:hypothetical protein EVAR_31798_1 [Eumeta japonica]